MKKSVLCLAILVLCGSIQAQKIPNPQPYAQSIKASELSKHLQIVAGADMEGRDTPSPGLEKAAKYIETQLKSFGVQPGNNDSYRQYYNLVKDTAPTMVLQMGGVSFKAWEDFAPWMQMPAKTNLHFSEYIFVGYGIVDETRNDYKNVDVKGKLVILLSGQPNGFTTKKSARQSPAAMANKIKTAQNKGAGAVLVIAKALPANQKFSERYRPLPDEAKTNNTEPIPVFNINDNVVAASGHTIAEIESAVGSEVIDPIVRPIETTLSYVSTIKKAAVSNVIGKVEGSDKKDEYLFITAHYDHLGMDEKGNIFYGADDDGSGTVAVLEMAKAFAKAKREGKGPRRTIVFMLVSGEEKGLWGSEYYAAHPIYPLDKTTANLNIDMIGRVDTERETADTLNYVYVVGHNKLSTDLVKINEGMNNKYTKLMLDYKFDDPNDVNRIYYRSDHYNFARKGVPVLFFYDGMLQADYHQPTDTVDKIYFDLLTKRTHMIFYTAWEMANRKDQLKRDLKLLDAN